MDFPSSFASFNIVLLHVSLGRPLHLLPLSGVHLADILVTLLECFLKTCPHHFHLLLLVVVSMAFCKQYVYRPINTHAF